MLRELELKFYSAKQMVPKTIATRTGCLAPCTYTEYRLRLETYNAVKFRILEKIFNFFLQKMLGERGLILWNTSPFILVESEELLYSLPSLVAEVGGILGLFLGFSFMAIWEGVETFTEAVAKRYGVPEIVG